tara:strand:- start:6230 stop:6415 length:186 start_codon:yes stop_codon:yes gene_type:complete
MLEFVFGWLVGVWMGQQLPLPSVQKTVQDYMKVSEEPADENVTLDHPDVPIFTGEMPANSP